MACPFLATRTPFFTTTRIGTMGHFTFSVADRHKVAFYAKGFIVESIFLVAESDERGVVAPSINFSYCRLCHCVCCYCCYIVIGDSMPYWLDDPEHL